LLFIVPQERLVTLVHQDGLEQRALLVILVSVATLDQPVRLVQMEMLADKETGVHLDLLDRQGNKVK